MGLKLYRKLDQQVLLSVVPGTSAEELLEQLKQGITIRVCDIQRNQVRLSTTAPNCFFISRPEKHDAATWAGRTPIKRTIWCRLRQLFRAPSSPR